MTKTGKGMTKNMGNSGIVRVLEKEILCPLFCVGIQEIFFRSGGRDSGQPDVDRINATAVLHITKSFNPHYIMDVQVDLKLN